MYQELGTLLLFGKFLWRQYWRLTWDFFTIMINFQTKRAKILFDMYSFQRWQWPLTAHNWLLSSVSNVTQTERGRKNWKLPIFIFFGLLSFGGSILSSFFCLVLYFEMREGNSWWRIKCGEIYASQPDNFSHEFSSWGKSNLPKKVLYLFLLLE